MAEIKHIASKLAKVMASCRYIQRDRRNDFLKYNYASAAAVLERVSLACAEQNLATFAVSRVLSQAEKTNRSGMAETLVTVQTEVTLIDCDSGEAITFTGLGSGQDVGDKAVAKAQTMALKYAWMTTLNISTGDDPEADEGVDERAVLPGASLKMERCPECGSNAVLSDTEEVVGRTVGIYRCSNGKCTLKSFRLPVAMGKAAAGDMN
ncbi:MAG TPA: ERF family protein [Methanotrichaceae archaeon]|nr:ERF family protein [Methanotrichaceae archaeon]